MATQYGSAGKGRQDERGRDGREPAPEAPSAERDEVYGLISVLYHALQGAENYARYGEDARRAGDDELVEFFEECQDEEVERAERAKELLSARLDGYGEDADEAEEADEEEEEVEEEMDEER
jgi:hypothetical protein